MKRGGKGGGKRWEGEGWMVKKNQKKLEGGKEAVKSRSVWTWIWIWIWIWGFLGGGFNKIREIQLQIQIQILFLFRGRVCRTQSL